MDKDKESNEAYFKARVSELLEKYGVTDHARVKGLKIDLYGLHDEVKNRIDPTEKLPFGKEVCICECEFPDIDNPNVRIGLCGNCHRPIINKL